MKNLQPHTLAPIIARTQWDDFSTLLTNKTTLSEQRDVLPFFKNRKDLSLLICNYFPRFKSADCFAHEFAIYGDFVADLIVGDSKAKHYLLIEFEDGAPNSVFKTKGKKATPDWSSRFEGAHSQLVDWLWKLEDMRSTADFQNTFGSRRATFQGLIVIGKDMNLTPQEVDRLDWRVSRTKIDSNSLECVSFDQLASDLDHWLKTYHRV
ncbi:Shedu immune nuclease family protein [Pseudomonas syringae]|uniref:Shedu immune nuclease family protein n=1 Tax=Pseudomonas syringae TaxID=317 RepID=UPI003CEE7B58